MTHSRMLTWPSCYNVRDLGGLPTKDGQTTRLGAIVRSDLPSRLTEAGQQSLLAYGIRTILDLRKPDQVAEEPSIFMAGGTKPNLPTYTNISLENHHATIDEQIHLAGNCRPDVYCLILDHNQPQVAQIMQTIADAPPGGVLVHCSAGKDRTGLVSALLLGLVGVPDELIADDYALSQAQLWPLYEQLVEKAGGEAKVGWWLKPVATPPMMLKTCAHLRKHYGSITGYLQHCGLSPYTLIQLRTRLLIE